MNEIFLGEWKLYRRDVARVPFAGEAPRGEAEFDAGVKPGEIRIFADATRPFVALILEDRGLCGRRIVPVSPFSAPASGRELQIGARVFQLWNTTVASRRFTDRSWRVDAVSPEELGRLAAAVAAAHPGRISAGEGVQAKYEREFLVGAGDFIPLAAPRERVVETRGWWRGAWGIAAGLAVCVGAAYVVLEQGRLTFSGVFRDGPRVEIAADMPVVELIDPEPEAEEPAMSVADVAVADCVAAAAPRLPVPAAAVRDPTPVPSVRMMSAAAQSLAATEFTSPVELPVSVLPLGFAQAAARTAGAGEFSYASPLKTVERAPEVTCRVAECPWNSRSRLVNVTAPVAAGVRVEVRFDGREVEGYRLVSGAMERPLNAYYEVVPRSLSALTGDFCTVTVKWRSADGNESRAAKVVAAGADELRGLPDMPRTVRELPSVTSPDDVGVDVKFR